MSDSLWMLKGFYLPAAVGRYGPKVWRVITLAGWPEGAKGKSETFDLVIADEAALNYTSFAQAGHYEMNQVSGDETHECGCLPRPHKALLTFV